MPQKGGIGIEHAHSSKKSFFERLLESLARLISGSLSLPKPDHKDWKRWLLPQMHRHQHVAVRNMKNQGNMTLPKEKNK